ncbi:MAG: hypothetical protein A3H29_15155 [Acidobacteria bacterium RIFCSPLOWO2_02_FULL_67_21]|nr:MAG: hypothetical protein A3H29_15155 [Acidobacteria bacterium RIFCSPLOWO2_02_FULL_67_21]
MGQVGSACVVATTLTVTMVGPWTINGNAQNGGRSETGSSPTAQTCAALLTLTGLPNHTTVITGAVLNPAGPAQAAANPTAVPTPALPEHCEVLGKLNERTGINGQCYAINFRLRLPTAWNGRFFFQGGGGTNGIVGNALGVLQGQQPTVALALGYAVVAQDAGHDNMVNSDPMRGGAQAFGFDPQARLDYGYDSYDQVTQVAKTLIRHYYNRAADKSYYVGCSEGGREGMMMSQRFPSYFDGILSCAPGVRLPRAAVAQAWDSQAFAAVARQANLYDSTKQPFLNKTFTDDDLLLASSAVLAACDGLDGLTDGMIHNFTACTTAVVQPKLVTITCRGSKTDSCLSPSQVTALKTVVAGPRTSKGEMIYAPWAWDAGISGQNWRAWKLGPYSAPANSAISVGLSANALAAVATTPPTPLPTTGGSAVAFSLNFAMDGSLRAISNTSDVYRASPADFMRADSTDLSAFKAHGGKLVIAQGVSDPVFSIVDTINWWNDLNRVNGGRANEFVRLFAVPGMNHCAGGPATDQFDAFGALVDWVEKGVAPNRIVAAARMSAPWPGRTRPLCVYPQQARYRGTGSIEDAENFVCR